MVLDGGRARHDAAHSRLPFGAAVARRASRSEPKGEPPATRSRPSRSPARLSTAHCAVSPGPTAGTVLAACHADDLPLI